MGGMADTELDQITARRRKLKTLRAQGIDPFPIHTTRTTTTRALKRDFPSAARPVTVVGRLRRLRWHGGSCFADLADGTDQLQLFFQRDRLGAAEYDRWLELLDVGDIIEAAGETMRTRRGEPTVAVTRLRLLTKALRPLPEKWHGLSDVEIRYRQRELDLLANPGVTATFVTRARILKALRHSLDDQGFLEVETPILQPIPSGALAEPFRTNHRALKADFYLRIAPELYLKRLIVGGFERVYELGRCFRNEGIDHRHNPEFTMLELYAAYADDQWLQQFTEKLLHAVIQAVHGRSTTPWGTDRELDFQPPYACVTYAEALQRVGLSFETSTTDLRRFAKAKRITLPARSGRGNMIDEIVKTLVLPTFVQPTFLTGHPLELSPLAKADPLKPGTVRRFQLVVAGFELVNAYAELNDPDEQRRRFAELAKRRQAGDREAPPPDDDFITALQIGLPPTAGWGLGVDRLTMLLTNQSAVKEVLLFPTLKPKRS